MLSIVKDEDADDIRKKATQDSGSGTIKSVKSEVCVKQVPETDGPPAFMQYMKGMNMDVVDTGYLQSHFQEEDEEEVKTA